MDGADLSRAMRAAAPRPGGRSRGWLAVVAAGRSSAAPSPVSPPSPSRAGTSPGHRARTVIALAAAVLAVVPAAWLAGNADRLGLASPLVVLANRTPGTLAAIGLLLLVVGVHRDTARRAAPACVPPPTTPPASEDSP